MEDRLVYETRSVKWAPWILIAFYVFATVQAIIRGVSLGDLASALVFGLGAVIVGVLVWHLAFRTTTRLQRTSTDLIASFPWRHAMRISLVELQELGIDPKRPTWWRLTTSDGVKIRVYVPSRKRAAFDAFRAGFPTPTQER